MQQLNLITSQTKEEIAIEFIRNHEPPEGYFLGFSGGKDSVVLYDLTVKAGVKFQAYYSATGIDAPELVKFIRDYYCDVIWKYPNWKGHRSFFGILPEKGFPTKFTRWCCDTLKKDPTKKVPLPNRLMGIRTEESFKRRIRPQIDKMKYLKQKIYKPIFYWLEWEIWDYIEQNNLPYCSLYDEGFHRLGCVICPFICEKTRRYVDKHKARWPKQYKAFEKAMLKLWDRKEWWRQTKKRYAMLPEEFLDNWYRGK